MKDKWEIPQHQENNPRDMRIQPNAPRENGRGGNSPQPSLDLKCITILVNYGLFIRIEDNIHCKEKIH